MLSRSYWMAYAGWNIGDMTPPGLLLSTAVRNLLVRRASGKFTESGRGRTHESGRGIYGIGHTRWATHGRPTEENAHPHRDCKGRIVVVHNGIVENYLSLKQQLKAEGHNFKTETDHQKS